MFEVYCIRTGVVVRRCKDVIKANQLAIDYTSSHEWVDNDKFDFRLVVEDKKGKPLTRCIA